MAIKNHYAAEYIYNAYKNTKTCGVLERDEAYGITKIAEPIGIVGAVIPTTNPTSTAIFKTLISLKTRNAIIISPHPAAAKCTIAAAKLVLDAAVKAGAPEGIIGWVDVPSIELTNMVMRDVDIILATGGPGMVKAAYSSGKPALGVGAGNTPVVIDDTADVLLAVNSIIHSKTFDNGMICASEQSVICEECNRDQVIAEFKKQGGYFMTAEETAKVCNLLFKNGGHSMSAKFVGRSAQVIATAAGISIPDGTRVLIGEQQGVGDGYPLSYEKLTTVLAFYTVRDWHEAYELSIKLLQNGIGHTMNIHTNDPQIVREFSRKPASRILVNTGGTQGGTGASTALAPAFTLGCGTWGGSATSENVTPMNLVNIKKVVYGLKDVTTLAQSDPTFRPDFGCCRGSNAAGAQPSPMQFSGSCNCTTGNQGLPAQDGIDGKQLLELVNELVNAMKGGN